MKSCTTGRFRFHLRFYLFQIKHIRDAGAVIQGFAPSEILVIKEMCQNLSESQLFGAVQLNANVCLPIKQQTRSHEKGQPVHGVGSIGKC